MFSSKAAAIAKLLGELDDQDGEALKPHSPKFTGATVVAKEDDAPVDAEDPLKDLDPELLARLLGTDDGAEESEADETAELPAEG
jgi:hypothetical protein